MVDRMPGDGAVSGIVCGGSDLVRVRSIANESPLNLSTVNFDKRDSVKREKANKRVLSCGF
jgi:hypothetical protein